MSRKLYVCRAGSNGEGPIRESHGRTESGKGRSGDLSTGGEERAGRPAFQENDGGVLHDVAKKADRGKGR